MNKRNSKIKTSLGSSVPNSILKAIERHRADLDIAALATIVLNKRRFVPSAESSPCSKFHKELSGSITEAKAGMVDGVAADMSMVVAVDRELTSVLKSSRDCSNFKRHRKMDK